MAPFNGLLNIRIFEHDIGTLATEFQSHLLQPGSLNDLLSNGSGARESNLVDTRMAHDCRSSGLSETRKDVDCSGRESSFLNERTKVQSAQGCLFGCLKDDGITTSKCRGNLPS